MFFAFSRTSKKISLVLKSKALWLQLILTPVVWNEEQVHVFYTVFEEELSFHSKNPVWFFSQQHETYYDFCISPHMFLELTKYMMNAHSCRHSLYRP